MPTGPQGQKRPADMIGGAVTTCKIAVGDIEEELDEKRPKRSRAAKAGGQARAKSLDPERRSEIAAQAAKARWE